MLKDLVLLSIGGLFGLGATLMAVAAPLYFKSVPLWVWHWSFWGGLVLMVLMAIDLFILLLGGRLIVSPGPASLVNVGVACLAAAVIWQTSGDFNRNLTPPKQTLSLAPSLQTTEPVSLFFECDNDFLPASLPQTGRVWAIELAWNPEVPHQGGQNKEMFGQPGTPLVWFDDNDYRNPYRCEIRNYSTGAIFNIFLEFDVIFSSYIQVFDGGPVTGREGPMIAKAKTNIKISRLDVGPNNPFVFYIYNQSAYSVHLSMPNSVLVGADDFGRGGQTETITTNTMLPLYFAPRTKQPTGHPAGPLPPPMPPK